MAKKQNKQPVNNPAQPEPTNSNKIQNEALAIERDMADLSVKMIENDKQRELILQRIKKLRVDINKNTELDKDQTKQLLTLMREGIKLTTIKNNNDTKARKNQDATLKLIEEQGNELREIATTEKKIQAVLDKKQAAYEAIGKATNEETRLKKRALKLDIDAAEKLQTELDTRKKILLMSDEERKIREQSKKAQDTLTAGIKDQLGFVDTLADSLKNIPVVGNVLYKMLDVDKFKDKISEKIGGSLMKAFGGASKGAAALEGGMAGATRGAMVFGTTLTVATGGVLLIIGAIVLAMKAMWDVAMEIDKSTADIAKNLNISKDASNEILTSLGEQGVLYENTVKYSSMLAENFGRSGNILLREIGPRMQDLQHNMQLSDEEMSSLLSASYLLGSSLQGTNTKASEFETAIANTTAEYYNQLGVQLEAAELANEIRATMQDIGKLNKRDIALYSRSTKELTKQVTAVRRLGLEFESVTKVMDKVLDIEQSLEQEMQTNILLGKHFNLNAVRSASLFGDVDDVAKSITESFEQQNISLEEFNKMTPFRKKQLEELYGMQADEIQLMLLRGKLNKEELDNLSKTSKASKDELKNIEAKLKASEKLSDEEVQLLMTAERRTTAAQDLEYVQAQFTQLLKNNMKGLTGLVEGLADFGARVSDTSLLKAIFGFGRGQAEQEVDRILEENKKIEEANELKKSGKQLSATEAMLVKDYAGRQQGEISKELRERAWAEKYGKYDARPAEDFVFRENGGLQTFSKGDLIMGIDENSLSSYSNASRNNASENASSTEAIALLKTQNELLGKLLQKVDQPVKMNIGGRVIEELDSQASLRRSYTAGVDKSYRSF